MRMTRLISSAALLYVMQVIGGHAQVYCKRFEQLPAVSDRATLRSLERYLRKFDSSKTHLVRNMTSPLIGTIERQFFIAVPDSGSCKGSSCYYRLLDLRNGVINEVFSFHGTGVLWYYDVAAYVDYFQDWYHMIDVETSEQSYIRIGLPRGGDPINVGAAGREQAGLPEGCPARSR
jgi:hypothetical protein